MKVGQAAYAQAASEAAPDSDESPASVEDVDADDVAWHCYLLPKYVSIGCLLML